MERRNDFRLSILYLDYQPKSKLYLVDNLFYRMAYEINYIRTD